MDVNFICLPDKNLAHPGITLVQNDISAIYNALFILSTNSFTVQCFFISSFGIVWSSEAMNYTKINIEITKIFHVLFILGLENPQTKRLKAQTLHN